MTNYNVYLRSPNHFFSGSRCHSPVLAESRALKVCCRGSAGRAKGYGLLRSAERFKRVRFWVLA